MALTFTQLAPFTADVISATGGGTITLATSGLSTPTAGSLIIAMFYQEFSGTPSNGEANNIFAESTSALSGLTQLGAKYLTGTTTLIEYLSFTGAANSLNSAQFSVASGPTNAQYSFVEITGASGLTILQSKLAKATNATCSVTLDNAVQAGNECYAAMGWDDPSDAGTAGSGWTALTQHNSVIRLLEQYHHTPSGAQNSSVSNIASLANVSAIFEINNPSISRDGGWGFIPIN